MTAVVAVPAGSGHPPSGRPRLRAAPRLDPPYDDELGVPASAQAEQLRFDKPLPWPVARAAPPAPPPSRRRLPDPRPWARQFLLVALETMAGRRPAGQLARWASPSAVAGVRTATLRTCLHAAPPTAADRLVPTLHSVHVQEPVETVAEVCAVLRCGTRYRALAARLEWFDRHWRCVHFRLL